MKKRELLQIVERLKEENVKMMEDIRVLISDDREFDKLMLKSKYEYLDRVSDAMWAGCIAPNDGLFNLAKSL